MNRHPDSARIDALGGPTAVAKLFGIKPQAVSAWRADGIPKARRMYLQLLRPMEMGGPPELIGGEALPAAAEACHAG